MIGSAIDMTMQIFFRSPTSWLVAALSVASVGLLLSACGSSTSETARQVETGGAEATPEEGEGLNIQPRSTGAMSQEELREVARDIAALQERPFGTPGAEDGLRHLTVWLFDNPDVTITVCGSPYDGFLNTDDPFLTVMKQHFMLAMARFIIEHPDRIEDLAATHQAGFEGLARVYELAKADDPANERPGLERILELRDTEGFEGLAQRIDETCVEDVESGADEL
jgi:hypothetical protein